MLHFLKLLDSKNEREHKIVAIFEASRQQKRAGTRGCCNLFIFMRLQKLPERPLAALGPKNELPHNNFNCRNYFFAGLEFLGNL